MQQQPLQAKERDRDDANAQGVDAARHRHAETAAELERCDHRPDHRAFDLRKTLRIPRTAAYEIAEQHQEERQHDARVVAGVVALQPLGCDAAEDREQKERADEPAHARAAREARRDEQHRAGGAHRCHGEQNIDGLAGRLDAS
ncbi:MULTISPECIES: hypothetical protein [unclassified Caballeronia]|uniref:hypothetical protein n=1 Tax=unclassified Caballeronia TaxID=2646786 RepID=UPI002028E3D4|nr:MULTISPECIES: hypothetical protein [unclassified Caballeronia]